MFLFVFGLFFFRKFVRPPKGLIVSFFISYILLLIACSILFGLKIPETLMRPYDFVVMDPSFCIIGCIAALFNHGPTLLLKGLKELGLLQTAAFALNDASWIWSIVVDWVALCMNTFFAFAIIRLILHIKHKVSAKKPQNVPQAD
jgi:hypothetical protein